MQNISDEKLIADYLVNGQTSSFNQLIKKYLKPVYNFVYRLSGNKEEASDITQEIFLKVWRNIKKYKMGQSFRAWLFAIARNATIDWLRKKKTFVFSDFEDAEGNNFLTDTLADPSPLANELIIKSERKKLVRQALESIPLAYREVLFLRYNDHFTFQEIGQATGKPLNTVKSQHARALIMLQKRLRFSFTD